MKFIAEDDQLVVQLEGVEKFWALRNKLVIPKANITDIQWQPEFTLAQPIWRWAGSDVPGSIWAGRFRGGGQKYFLYVLYPQGLTWFRHPRSLQNILSITTYDYPYQRILLTCQPDIGAGLLNWWQGN